MGDPADPDVEVGPIVTERAMDEILAAIDRARAEGACSWQAVGAPTTRAS